MASVIDLYLAYRFLKNLVLPFDKWDAFKTGVIDKDGAILVSKDSRTQEQKGSFGYFDLIGLNLKKLLGKLPGGKSAIASYAAALLLLKEYEKKQVNEEYSEYVDMQWLEEEFYACLEEVKQMFDEEGAPTNNVSGGNVAGTVGDPPVSPKNKYKAQNEIDSKHIARRALGMIRGAK